MEEQEIDKTTEYIIGKELSTVCEHDMVRAPSDPNSNLVSYQCTKCNHGESRSE